MEGGAGECAIAKEKEIGVKMFSACFKREREQMKRCRNVGICAHLVWKGLSPWSRRKVWAPGGKTRVMLCTRSHLREAGETGGPLFLTP